MEIHKLMERSRKEYEDRGWVGKEDRHPRYTDQ